MTRKNNQNNQAGFNLAAGARYIGTSRPTFTKMLNEGVIQHRRYGKRVFISKQALDAFLLGEK